MRTSTFFSLITRSPRSPCSSIEPSSKSTLQRARASTGAAFGSSATGVATTTSPALMPASTSTVARALRADANRDALDAIAAHAPDEARVAVARDRARRHAHARSRRRRAEPCSARRAARIEERHLDAHVRAGSADRARRSRCAPCTVAFCRSAVGTMLMTWLGMTQSGYASSMASRLLPGLHAVDEATR